MDQESPSHIPLAPGVSLPESTVRFTFSRSSGPGGQNVNKLSTKAQLHVPLAALRERIGDGATMRLASLAGPARLTAEGEVMITADDTRSQRMNRSLCIERLRDLVLQALRPPRLRRRTRPTRGSKERRIESKKRRGAIKSHRRDPRDES